MWIDQGPGDGFALAGIFAGDLGVKLAQPDIELGLQALNGRLPFRFRHRWQPANLVFQFPHQAIALYKILITVHMSLK